MLFRLEMRFLSANELKKPPLCKGMAANAASGKGRRDCFCLNLLFQNRKAVRGMPNVEEKLRALRAKLLYHAKRYYVDDDPEISDYEYDMMYAELLKLEAAHPEFSTPRLPHKELAANRWINLKRLRTRCK